MAMKMQARAAQISKVFISNGCFVNWKLSVTVHVVKYLAIKRKKRSDNEKKASVDEKKANHLKLRIKSD